MEGGQVVTLQRTPATDSGALTVPVFTIRCRAWPASGGSCIDGKANCTKCKYHPALGGASQVRLCSRPNCQ